MNAPNQANQQYQSRRLDVVVVPIVWNESVVHAVLPPTLPQPGHTPCHYRVGCQTLVPYLITLVLLADFVRAFLVFCTALSPGAVFVDAQIALLGVELNKCVNELKRRRLEAKEHAEQMKVLYYIP